MIEKLLMILAVSFAGAFPLTARAEGIPLFGQVDDGVFKQFAVIEAAQPEGLHVLFCLTPDGKQMQCVALAEDADGGKYILISKAAPVATQAGQ